MTRAARERRGVVREEKAVRERVRQSVGSRLDMASGMPGEARPVPAAISGEVYTRLVHGPRGPRVEKEETASRGKKRAGSIGALQGQKEKSVRRGSREEGHTREKRIEFFNSFARD